MSRAVRQVLLLGQVVFHLSADGLEREKSAQSFHSSCGLCECSAARSRRFPELRWRGLAHTSSRFVCFCRLALREDDASDCWVSWAGRGILEAAGLLAKGMLPLPLLGVPRIVLPDIVVGGEKQTMLTRVQNKRLLRVSATAVQRADSRLQGSQEKKGKSPG